MLKKKERMPVDHRKGVSVEAVVFSAIFFGIFILLGSKMGASNMFNTLMNTAHNLLINTIFYIMSITVLAGAIASLWSEFGLTALLSTLIAPLMKPVYGLPKASAVGVVITYLSDNLAMLNVTDNEKFRRNFKKYHVPALCNLGTSFGMGLIITICMMGLKPVSGENLAFAVVIGNVGAIKKLKKDKPDLIIALCGCMMQQKHIADKIKNSYPFVSIVFGTHVTHKMPELIYSYLKRKKRVFCIEESEGVIAEGLPTSRDSKDKAWLPIMYGCNNFCSYCIVPYVRGRERSRNPEVIINEAKSLISEGYKFITLLGQNVNSYGKGCDFGVSFTELIKMLDSIEGDFQFDFMTSHPKDCTFELIDALSECEHFCGHLHLPVQSGNNRILKEMNRHYTREHYLELVNYAKSKIKNVDLTTDIIVGFPGETYDEFLDTVSLIKEVRYGSMFTFIYSPRKGTPAAEMDDPYTKEEKTKWFMELLAVQDSIQKS